MGIHHLGLDELGSRADVDGQHIVPDGRPSVLAVDNLFLQVYSYGLRVHQNRLGKSGNLLQVDVALLHGQKKEKKRINTQ